MIFLRVMESENDRIKNREKLEQFVNYDGCNFGNIYPTDIDAVYELGGKVLVLIEIKVRGKQMPHGQILALERICDAWEEAKGPSFVFKVEHSQPVFMGDIYLKDLYVSSYYYRRKWNAAPPKKTVMDLIRAVLRKKGMLDLIKEK